MIRGWHVCGTTGRSFGGTGPTNTTSQVQQIGNIGKRNTNGFFLDDKFKAKYDSLSTVGKIAVIRDNIVVVSVTDTTDINYSGRGGTGSGGGAHGWKRSGGSAR